MNDDCFDGLKDSVRQAIEINEMIWVMNRWAQMEPNRCIIYLIDRAVNVWCDDRWHHAGFTVGDMDYCRIQWAVQLAIRARKWSYAVGRKAGCAGAMEAFGRVMSHEETASSEPAALLKAYLHMMEEAQNE